jgi:hypothetical protein
VLTPWTKIHVVVGIPSRRGLQPETREAVAEIGKRLEERGASAVLKVVNAGATCGCARGLTFAAFLDEPNATHLLSLDDDLVVSGDAIVKLVELEASFAGIAYRFRQDAEAWTCQVTREECLQEPDERGSIQVSRLGGGLILYKREVAQELAERFGFFTYRGVRGLRATLETVTEDGRYLTEDYALCDKWRSIGGQIRLLLDATTAHIDPNGTKYAGNFGLFFHRYRKLWAEAAALAQPGAMFVPLQPGTQAAP